jgi:hypothetical protein
MNKNKIEVQGLEVRIKNRGNEIYISLNDIAKMKNPIAPNEVIRNWMRSRTTVEFLGVWETINNPAFKPVEFDGFRKEAGLNYFTLAPQKWIDSTNAIGIISNSGKYGGTYAHQIIAMEFANWISVEFRLYMIYEFQRLKTEESKQIAWSAKRELAKINYRIQTDSIEENLIPKALSSAEVAFIYANEADRINKALFSKTASEWKNENKEKDGNLRDYATIEQLLVLANLESLNAELIRMGTSNIERTQSLNEAAIRQMKSLILHGDNTRLNNWSEKKLLLSDNLKKKKVDIN